MKTFKKLMIRFKEGKSKEPTEFKYYLNGRIKFVGEFIIITHEVVKDGCINSVTKLDDIVYYKFIIN